MDAGELEEWDELFLEEARALEDLALSKKSRLEDIPVSSAALRSHHSNPLPDPSLQSSQRFSPVNFHHPPSYDGIFHNTVCYSPPRELSQRKSGSTASVFPSSVTGNYPSSSNLHFLCSEKAEETEIQRLKRDRCDKSNEHSDLQHKLLEIKKGKDAKNDKIPPLFPLTEAREVDVECIKSSKFQKDKHDAVRIRSRSGLSLQCQNENYTNDQSTSHIDLEKNVKTVGVQTDEAGTSTHLTEEKYTQLTPSKKLLSIWDCSDGQVFQSSLVSKLMTAYTSEFHSLFKSLSKRMPAENIVNSHAMDGSFDMTSVEGVHPDPSDAAKVSNFYFAFTKIGNGLIDFEALIKSLLDLCYAKDVVLVHNSLKIMHAIVNHLLSVRTCYKRDCFVFEGLCFKNNVHDLRGSKKSNIGDLFSLNRHKTQFSLKWAVLYDVMRQVAVMTTSDLVKLEAVSIMNAILFGTVPFSEREEFGQSVLFESLSQFLAREAGCLVQEQALRLLFTLLNCQKLLDTFYSGYKNECDNTSGHFIAILDGLADCLSGCESGKHDLIVRRNTIMVLSFLVSSGKSGFEIFLTSKLSKGTNFIVLILEALMSEIKIEADECTSPHDISLERKCLFREAMIFLNRIASNSATCRESLHLLTCRRNIASLAMDIATRLSRIPPKYNRHSLADSEIMNFAQTFKKRIFNYLGG